MVKIKILDRGFSTTHFGFLEADSVVGVPAHFADYCVERMKSAVLVETAKPKKSAKAKK